MPAMRSEAAVKQDLSILPNPEVPVKEPRMSRPALSKLSPRRRLAVLGSISVLAVGGALALTRLNS
jgi:hypothetical protein